MRMLDTIDLEDRLECQAGAASIKNEADSQNERLRKGDLKSNMRRHLLTLLGHTCYRFEDVIRIISARKATKKKLCCIEWKKLKKNRLEKI